MMSPGATLCRYDLERFKGRPLTDRGSGNKTLPLSGPTSRSHPVPLHSAPPRITPEQTGGHTGQGGQESLERGTVRGAAGALLRQGKHRGTWGGETDQDRGGGREPGPLLHPRFGLVQAM